MLLPYMLPLVAELGRQSRKIQAEKQKELQERRNQRYREERERLKKEYRCSDDELEYLLRRGSDTIVNGEEYHGD